MELRPGYISTEVGVIPEEWDVKPLSAVLARARLGGNYPNQRAESDFPLMKMGNVARGVFDVSDVEYVSPRTNPEAQHRLSYGDVLFNTRNTLDLVGKVAIWRDELPIAYYNSNLLRLEFKPSEIASNIYANYWLNTATAVSRLRALATGTTSVAAIYTRDLLGFNVVVPPTVEQSAIATALSDVDALLVAQDRLIVKKRAIKQGAMQELLTGKRRLPGFGENTKCHLTEIGDVPEDWSLTKLEELVDPSRPIRYGIVQPGKYDPVGRYMIRGQDYSAVNGWASPEEVFRVSHSVEYRYRNARVRTGDLIMTIVGYCGHVEQIPGWLNGANLTQTTARISIDGSRASSSFCRYMLQSSYGIRQVSEYLKGAAQPGLNIGDVEKFLVPLPSMDEQEAISLVLREIDGEIEALQAKREKAALLKQGMMQALLTGRIRLI